jgi:hypothetical protein
MSSVKNDTEGIEPVADYDLGDTWPGTGRRNHAAKRKPEAISISADTWRASLASFS